MIFCIVFKVFSRLSARRFGSDLREAKARGLIKTVPCPTSLAEYTRYESLYLVLQNLLVKSSLPLCEVETVFAVDSTGFGTPRRKVWFNRHANRHEKRRDYVKLHAMVGVKSNVMSAESMYTVLLRGGIPYIAFRKNCALDADYKSTFWKDMLYLYKTRHPVFTEHYFLRNNVEATFHSMKAKFGTRLLSKSKFGQFNEALAKAMCHNICMLIRSSHELGIDPLAWSGKTPRPTSEGVPLVEAMAHRKEDLLEIREAAGNREMPPPKERKRSQKVKAPKNSKYASIQIQLFE
jgi:hypothetical protein